MSLTFLTKTTFFWRN